MSLSGQFCQSSKNVIVSNNIMPIYENVLHPLVMINIVCEPCSVLFQTVNNLREELLKMFVILECYQQFATLYYVLQLQSLS